MDTVREGRWGWFAPCSGGTRQAHPPPGDGALLCLMVSFQRDGSQVLENPELRDSREASLAIKTIYIHFGRAEKFLKERGSGRESLSLFSAGRIKSLGSNLYLPLQIPKGVQMLRVQLDECSRVLGRDTLPSPQKPERPLRPWRPPSPPG